MKLHQKVIALLCLLSMLLLNTGDYSSAAGIRTSAGDLVGIIDIDFKRSINTALQKDGTVWTWTENHTAAIKGPTIPNAVQVTSGQIALKQDGTVWTWDSGKGNAYIKAKGIQAKRNEPVQVTELSGIKAVESGSGHIALDKDGVAWVWGADGCMSYFLREDASDSNICRYLTPTGEALPYPDFLSIPARSDENIAFVDWQTDVLFVTKKGIAYRVGVWDNVHMGGEEANLTGAVKGTTQLTDNRGLIVGINGEGIISLGPVNNLSGAGFTDVSIAPYYPVYLLGVHKDGSVWGVGEEEYMIGTKLEKLKGLSGIVQVKAKAINTGIALDKNGFVWQWGSSKPSYGNDTTPMSNIVKPVKVQRAFSVILNGSELPMSSGPINVNGSTLVPMRELFQALGATVLYDNGKITAEKGDLTIKLEVYRHEADVNGDKLTMREAPTYYLGRTYVPLRFLSETLGAKVSWDWKKGAAIIDYK